VAKLLVEADLRGVDSHGTSRLPTYVQRIRAGLVNRDPNPVVERREGALALVDGDGGPGQVAGLFATELAMELARDHGVGAVGVRHSTHYGAAAAYVIRPAREGLIALSTTNAEPLTVPFGGGRAALGTNAIAFGAPTGGRPFVLDMATSQVAANRVFLAREEGEPSIPEGWAVDAEGLPVTDPVRAVSVVPLGGYKGYGLALMVEVLSAVLTGAGVTHGVGRLYDEWDRPQDVGHFFCVLDPERMVGLARFTTVLDGLLGELRSSPPAPGFDEVLVAGDPQERTQRERERSGIPLGGALWASLETLSAELQVEVPV
jgi:LDH2 family malate/lactate/ureidoglycolate dehydrogenase